MKTGRQSDLFQINRFFWKLFGIWPGNTPTRYYKYFSVIFVTLFTIVYNVILTVNLIYTPGNIEDFIPEVTFLFTEVAVMTKVAMIILMRDRILSLMKLMDCDEFKGTDDYGKAIIEKCNAAYKIGWRLYAIVSHFSYCALVIIPLMLHLIFKRHLDLPIAKYYFLSDEIKQDYFRYFFVYQSVGIYGHMTYNINTDAFIAGLIYTGIVQLKVLNHNFSRLQVESESTHKTKAMKLRELLVHYDIIVTFCSDVQRIASVVMFVQFCMAAAIICVSMCGLLMVSSASDLYGMIAYLGAMTTQIFVPGLLGTHLSHECQELINAAYNSDWIPQSESYKRSLRLFISRANTPIVITGLKIFPLSLGTFLSIMKMAYSLFALLRKVQDRQA